MSPLLLYDVVAASPHHLRPCFWPQYDPISFLDAIDFVLVNVWLFSVAPLLVANGKLLCS